MIDIHSLWNFQDPSESEARFRALLPETEQTGDVALRLELLTQIARTLALRGRFEEAHAVLDSVEHEILPGMDRVRVRYLLERGRAFNSSDHADKAKPLFLDAWEMARAAGEEFLAVDAAHMVAILETGQYAEEWNRRALDYAETCADPKARGWRASLYNNLGWTLHDEDRFAEALEVFRMAVSAREEMGEPETLRIAHWAVARCLRSLGRVDEALAMQEEQIRMLADQQRGPGPYVCEEIAECLHALGREDEARPWFGKAYEALAQDEWLSKKEPDRIARLKELADGQSSAG